MTHIRFRPLHPYFEESNHNKWISCIYFGYNCGVRMEVEILAHFGSGVTIYCHIIPGGQGGGGSGFNPGTTNGGDAIAITTANLLENLNDDNPLGIALFN